MTNQAKTVGVIGALRPTWLAQADSDLADMVRVLDLMAKPDAELAALSKQLHGRAHDMKGQAGTFGFGLASEIAARLCAFLREHAATVTPDDLPILRAHHAALKFVIGKGIEGDGGEAGRAILAKLSGLLRPTKA